MRAVRTRRRRGGFVGSLFFVGLMATAGYAFTASNTMTDAASQAGSGTAAVSGYTVKNVGYAVNSTTPSKLSTVTFDVYHGTGLPKPKASNVYTKLVSTGTTYNQCSDVTAEGVTTYSSWSCSLGTGVNVSDADQLTVIAAQ